MDRIEQLMKDAKPRVMVPGAAPGADTFHSMVAPSDPDVVSLDLRAPSRSTSGRGTPTRRRALRGAAATVLAAAAVLGAVVVGGNLLPPAPGPAQTGVPSPPVSASTPPVSPTASSSSDPTPMPATPPAQATTAAALTTGGVACTPANIDQLRNDQQRTILPIPPAEQSYYTVLGCTDGWLAYSISDEGAKALQLDGGNAWFRIAKLQNGRFLWDVRQPWGTIFNWEFQALNNQGLTAQQAMDQEFAQKGLPVELRPRLVGGGPTGG